MQFLLLNITVHLPKNQTQVESQPKEGISTTMMSSTISLDDVDPSTVVLGEDSDPSLPKKRKNSSGSSGTKRRKRNVIYKEWNTVNWYWP